jgi:hypothetical protein
MKNQLRVLAVALIAGGTMFAQSRLSTGNGAVGYGPGSYPPPAYTQGRQAQVTNYRATAADQDRRDDRVRESEHAYDSRDRSRVSVRFDNRNDRRDDDRDRVEYRARTYSRDFCR